MLRGPRGYVLYGLGILFVLELMLGGAVYFWPTFMESFAAIKNMAKFSPILEETMGQINTGGVTAYIAGQHWFKGCSALGVAAAILFAANAIAGDAQRGTLELVLARPVSRRRIYFERWFGGLATVLVPVALSSATIPPLMRWMIDDTMPWDDVARSTFYMCAFLTPIYAATFAWSARGTEPVQITYTMLFLSILAFALYFVEVTTDYSPFRLVDIREFVAIAENDAFSWVKLGPLLAASLVLNVVGLRWFLARTP